MCDKLNAMPRLCAAALAALMLSASVAFPDEVKRRPAVLFISHPMSNADGGTYLRDNMARLDKKGYSVAWMTFPKLYANPTLVRNFDCVVALSVEPVDKTSGALPQGMENLKGELKELLSDGGGLMLFTCAGGEFVIKGFNQFAKPYDVRMLSGCLVDQAPAQGVFGAFLCAYSAEIASSPLTDGVKALWYPVAASATGHVDIDIGRNPKTAPYSAGATWRTLASAASTTTFRPFGKAEGGDSAELQGLTTMSESAPPLLSIREGVAGSGRMAVCGINSVFSNFCAGNAVYDGVCTGKGLNGKSSDLDRLQMNVLDWLCEPSMAKGRKVASASMADTFKKAEFAYPPPKDIKNPIPLSPKPDQFKGVVGVRSNHSGGISTVEDYAKTAGRLGISFLAFLEDFEKLDSAAFEKLKEECVRHSSDKLALIPGLRFQTSLGINFFGFKKNLELPRESQLAPGTRRLRHFTFDGKSKQPDGAYNWVAANGYRTDMACGNFRLAEKEPSGIPPWNYNFHNPFVSLYTYNKGKLADEMLDTYLKCAARTEWVSPICVDLIDSAEELETEWNSDHFKTVWLRDPGEGLPGFNRCIGERGHHLPAAYITNGPVIDEWTTSGTDCDGGFYDWTRLLWRLRFTVSSEAGLKEVKVMDGTRLFRRYDGHGDRSMTEDMTLTHNDMHNMILIVTDNAGRTAISDELWDKNQLLQLTWCIDRNNMLSYAGLPAPKAPSGSTAGNYPAPFSLEKGSFRESLSLAINLDRSRLPGFDGQPCHIVDASPAPEIISDQGREGGCFEIARDFARGMSSPDCAVHEISCARGYDKSVTHPRPWTKGPLVPLELFNATMTYTTFTHPGHTSAPVLLEGSLLVLKDLTFKNSTTKGLNARLLTLKAPAQGGYQTVTVQHSETGAHVASIRASETQAFGKFNKHSYIYFFPSMFGSVGVISLSDGLSYWSDGGNAHIGIDTNGRTLKAGERIDYKMLVFTSGFDEPTSTALPESLRNDLGMSPAGATTYRVDAEQGVITSREYILKIDGQGKGFAGVVTLPERFPAVLPMVVDNLCQNWASVLYERDSKRFRPLGMRQGAAYCHRTPDERSGELFIGHPFTADRPDIFISVAQTGKDELTLQLHNPGTAPVRTTLTRSPFFDFVSCPPIAADLPAGSTKTFMAAGDKLVECHTK